jgi:endonuclease/exonuclease/phosphatase family metal-dependent hydrolase
VTRNPLAALGLLMTIIAPAHASDIKIATWNLNWLTLRHAGDTKLPDDVHPRSDDDFRRLRGFADRLDADVVGFEEVDGVPAAARVFDPARYTVLTIDEDVVQRVGVAVRRGITVLRHPDLAALDVEPHAPHPLRDGFDATLRFPGGARLRILVVHLKTGCHQDDLARSARKQCALLAAQIPVLAAWVRARVTEAAPFAILGDFNRVLDQPDAMSSALDDAGALLRVTRDHSDPCWDGGSFIDHIFLGGAARAWLVPQSLRVLVYRSSVAADRERLSDHCPVSAKLNIPDQAGAP